MCFDEFISFFKLNLKPISAPTEPPSRPLVTGFTSRSVTLSWAKPRPSSNSPGEIHGYAITI